jgi:hypothetical protein
MPHIRHRPPNTYEIRESHRTPKGPRARTLASFTAPLTNRTLDLAEARASQQWDRAALIAEAKTKGIPFAESFIEADARRLLIDLRRNRHLNANLVKLLLDELTQMEAQPIAEELEDAVDWLGADVAERGSALCGLVRMSDQIAQSRSRAISPPAFDYPHLTAIEDEAGKEHKGT